VLRAGPGGTWLAFSPVMSRPSTLSPPTSEPSATRTFLSLALYVLATSLGLLLRVSFIQPLPWLHFGHALHAHSHTLYFGWAGLGLLTLAYEQVGATWRWPWGMVACGARSLRSGGPLPPRGHGLRAAGPDRRHCGGGARVEARGLGASLWLLALTAWLGAPLGVVGGDTGLMGTLARTAGTGAAVGAAPLVLAGILWLWPAVAPAGIPVHPRPPSRTGRVSVLSAAPVRDAC